MKKTHWLLVVLSIFLPLAANAQFPTNNPLVDASQKLGTAGLTSSSIADKAGWAFKQTGTRIYVKKYVEPLGDDANERATFEEAITAIIGQYEGVAKEIKQSNDPATALAFSVAILHSVASGSELDDNAFLALAGRLRATLSSVKATDLQKQEFYEWALCCSGIVVSLGAASQDEESKKKVRTMAEAQLIILLGAKLDQISLKGSQVSIKASAPIAETSKPPGRPDSGGTAPGFGFSLPTGWTTNSGWYVAEIRRDGDVSMAQVRIVPAVPASGSFSDALRAAWKKYVPEELQNKAGGMVFRRYIGSGLFAQFVCGSGPEKGKTWDSMFTVFLIDCGTMWQPVVVAQTWTDTYSQFPAGANLSASLSFGSTADLAEVFLRTLTCSGMKSKPIVDKATMVGDYNYGSSSALNFENVYTGATAMKVISYGGTLHLKADGTFADTFSSASGFVGATTFSSAKGKGKWVIDTDILVLNYTEYDQGDSYKRKQKKYRISGVVVFSSGEKVVVLKDSLETPINAVTVQDRSEYYSTLRK